MHEAQRNAPLAALGLRDLDRFYVAVEHAARTMTDRSDKQYFLNTVAGRHDGDHLYAAGNRRFHVRVGRRGTGDVLNDNSKRVFCPAVAFVNIEIRLFKPHQISLFSSGDGNGSLPPRNTIVSSSLDIVATHGVRNTQTQRQLAFRGSSRRSITC